MLAIALHGNDALRTDWFPKHLINFKAFAFKAKPGRLPGAPVFIFHDWGIRKPLCAMLAVGGSVKQHLLASYLDAFVRVCNAQRARYTRMRGYVLSAPKLWLCVASSKEPCTMSDACTCCRGLPGVKALLQQMPLRDVLLQAGVDQKFSAKAQEACEHVEVAAVDANAKQR